ncbi:hypothetical protein CARN8_4530001 [mine drainage metagenome]|uniref:Uncharacterized protein n=1 Tax=mine drainage metagenome TaxID=410659 RepID=A0A3P3ZPV6_9ZZZZ
MPPHPIALAVPTLVTKVTTLACWLQLQDFLWDLPIRPPSYCNGQVFSDPGFQDGSLTPCNLRHQLAYHPLRGGTGIIQSPNASHQSDFSAGMPLFHYTKAINDPHSLRYKVPAKSTLAHWP